MAEILFTFNITGRTNDASRIITIYDDMTADIICNNCYYYTCNGELTNIKSIDPNDGPYFYIGMKLSDSYYIDKFISHEHIDAVKQLIIKINIHESK
jgi:hypothetical protein